MQISDRCSKGTVSPNLNHKRRPPLSHGRPSCFGQRQLRAPCSRPPSSGSCPQRASKVGTSKSTMQRQSLFATGCRTHDSCFSAVTDSRQSFRRRCPASNVPRSFRHSVHESFRVNHARQVIGEELCNLVLPKLLPLDRLATVVDCVELKSAPRQRDRKFRHLHGGRSSQLKCLLNISTLAH